MAKKRAAKDTTFKRGHVYSVDLLDHCEYEKVEENLVRPHFVLRWRGVFVGEHGAYVKLEYARHMTDSGAQRVNVWSIFKPAIIKVRDHGPE